MLIRSRRKIHRSPASWQLLADTRRIPSVRLVRLRRPWRRAGNSAAQIPEPIPATIVRCFLYPVSGVFTASNLVAPYIQEWTFSIQHQLTSNTMLEASYAGKIGTKIEALRTFNPAKFGNDPITGAPASESNVNDRMIYEPGILGPQEYLLGNDFRSWYHSLQVQATKRFSQELSVVGSYTLAKSIDSSSTDNLGAQVANPFNLRQERGRSDWDRRHSFVVSWLYSPLVHSQIVWPTVSWWMDVDGDPNVPKRPSHNFLAGTGRRPRWHAEQPAARSTRAGSNGQHHQLSHPNRNDFVQRLLQRIGIR